MVIVETFVGAAPVQQVLGKPSKETELSGFLLVTGNNRATRLSISLLF
jgi:hypothetical protein